MSSEEKALRILQAVYRDKAVKAKLERLAAVDREMWAAAGVQSAGAMRVLSSPSEAQREALPGLMAEAQRLCLEIAERAAPPGQDVDELGMWLSDNVDLVMKRWAEIRKLRRRRWIPFLR